MTTMRSAAATTTPKMTGHGKSPPPLGFGVVVAMVAPQAAGTHFGNSCQGLLPKAQLLLRLSRRGQSDSGSVVNELSAKFKLVSSVRSPS